MRHFIVQQFDVELAIVAEVSGGWPVKHRPDSKVCEPTEVSQALDGFVLTRAQLANDRRGAAALQSWEDGRAASKGPAA